MSGRGERFRRAGYVLPKPLIEVDKKPIIHYVIDMFPGETKFTFICNEEHIQTTNMEKILNSYCPTGKIVTISPHKKGPVYAVSKIFNLINNEEQAIVNYCDFTCYWDYTNFKKSVNKLSLNGALPAYRGFHPHSLGNTNYAYIRESNLKLLEIKEKEPFTQNRMQEFASTGTYYFSKGEYIKKYFQLLIDLDISINNEFYCSLVYNLMVKDGLNIGIHEIEYFMQWGTPQDLAEYSNWSKAFRRLASQIKQSNSDHQGTVMIPMAGLGSRFKKVGYQIPKPLIKINDLPMVVLATKMLPATTKQTFICLSEDLSAHNISSLLESNFKNIDIVELETLTKGQAITALKAMHLIKPTEPLIISACDHGLIYDHDKYNKLMSNSDVDIIIWVTRGHPGAIRNPEMYGWVREISGEVKGVSVKKALNNPSQDPIIIGTFTFKHSKIFQESVEQLIRRNGLINHEFYIDSSIQDAINLGYKCALFEVDHYLCWGTPNDLKTYQYWQNCFNKWSFHPYLYTKEAGNSKSL